jgi:hypothetical protein
MEAELFRALDGRLNPIHSSHFMKRFLRLVAPTTRITMLAHFVNELGILDERLIGMPPSLRGAAAVALALTVDRGDAHWTDQMRADTGYSVDEVQVAVETLLAIVHKFISSKFQASREKYSFESLGSVSQIEFPADMYLTVH